ncbi:hypothetical protein CCO03_13480 [Comamonas serinivorans]|uniref:Uncharacterized protein n=1 Tax=Comamonas serinivorans TaxID=1082851 RepID=A0A1Y0EPY8_9BURK|nr:hypothetical protein CCO03_13480 [Comamonas serinivorans]
MAARRWSDEQRRQQAQRIRETQPWRQSTGPRSVEGKQRSALNAFKGGLRPRLRALSREVNQVLREQRALLRQL